MENFNQNSLVFSKHKIKNILFYSNIHTSGTFFLSILLAPTYFTVLHGSGCCIRSMTYSIPMSAAKILRVTASHIHPVALCSYDYQIFHLHRACPSTGLSTTIPETAKFHIATQTPEKWRSCQSQGEDKSWPIYRWTAERSLLKDLAGREADLGWLTKERGQKARGKLQHRIETIEKLGFVLKEIKMAAMSTLILFLTRHIPFSCQKHCPTGCTVNAFQKYGHFTLEPHCHLPLPYFSTSDGLVVSISLPQINITLNWCKDCDNNSR